MNVQLRKQYQHGRHLLAFADGGADWCRRCGIYDDWLDKYPCEPEPRGQRLWPQRIRGDIYANEIDCDVVRIIYLKHGVLIL